MLSVNIILFKFSNFDWVFVKHDNISYFQIAIPDKTYVNLG